jgi:hypothetical protein
VPAPPLAAAFPRSPKTGSTMLNGLLTRRKVAVVLFVRELSLRVTVEIVHESVLEELLFWRDWLSAVLKQVQPS